MLLKLLKVVWAFPATAIGLAFAALALLSGGNVRIVRGAIEVQGGLAARFLRGGIPFFGSAAAMTLGHVILGRDQSCLDRSRDHEHVHVRQYERWGPFMLPIYATSSFILYLRGRDPYLDNPFEREAYREVSEE
jgi:hypothetical protein